MSFLSNRAAVYFEQKKYEACIEEVSPPPAVCLGTAVPSRRLSEASYCRKYWKGKSVIVQSQVRVIYLLKLHVRFPTLH